MKDSGKFGDGGSSTCQFLMRYPLYRLLDLSRVDNLPLCPTTEHSSHVSPTLRHRDAYSQGFSSHSKRKADLDVFDIIKGGVSFCVAREAVRKRCDKERKREDRNWCEVQ